MEIKTLTPYFFTSLNFHTSLLRSSTSLLFLSLDLKLSANQIMLFYQSDSVKLPLAGQSMATCLLRITACGKSARCNL